MNKATARPSKTLNQATTCPSKIINQTKPNIELLAPFGINKMLNIIGISIDKPNMDPRGILISITFKSGWGLSIAKHKFSHGGMDKWEIAVIGKDGLINYTNPLTNDVIGHLDESEVKDIIETVDSWK